ATCRQADHGARRRSGRWLPGAGKRSCNPRVASSSSSFTGGEPERARELPVDADHEGGRADAEPDDQPDERAAGDDDPAVSAREPVEAVHHRRPRSNSPALTPLTNASHSEGVKVTSWRVWSERVVPTLTLPARVRHTLTQLPPEQNEL